MSDHEQDPGKRPDLDGTPVRTGSADERVYVKSDVTPSLWVRRAVTLIVALAMGYLAYLVALAFFPRWWAQRVADQVGGDFTSGTLWGLFYGFVFTFVPLLLVLQLRRRFFSWTWRGIVLVVAVVLALPNWLTLSIVAGNSKAAHAGERILDVDGPGFRAATAIGVGVAVLLMVFLLFAGIAAARRKAQVKDLKGQLRDRKDVEPGDRQASTDEG